MQTVKTLVSWLLALLIVAVFVPSLFFKFSGHENSVYIFSQIDITMEQWFGMRFFEPNLRYGVGAMEALASLLLLIPAFRFSGAALSFVLMSGAIFFHLFTALGVAVDLPSGGGEPDPSLFAMAVVVWVASIILMVMSRGK